MSNVSLVHSVTMGKNRQKTFVTSTSSACPDVVIQMFAVSSHCVPKLVPRILIVILSAVHLGTVRVLVRVWGGKLMVMSV